MQLQSSLFMVSGKETAMVFSCIFLFMGICSLGGVQGKQNFSEQYYACADPETFCRRGLNSTLSTFLMKADQRLNRGSYISAHVLLNLLNELGKRDKCEACRAFYLFSQRV